jgi:UDP-N-acetylglucosamine:LPS N-acetylglucosamine transferase
MRICILYANSGAGHLAGARALKDAFKKIGIEDVDLVDFAVEYNIPIFSNSQKTYKFVLNNTAFLQRWIVRFFDMFLPAYFFRKLFTFFSNKKFKIFLEKHPADLYVSTYYADIDVFKQIKKHNPKAKTVMVVVDIMHSLRLWFDPIVDLIIVPTQEVYDGGYKYFKKYSNKVIIMGLPIAQNIFDNLSKDSIKAKLGLNSYPMILLAGGGEGMEQVTEIVNSIDKNNENLTLCVVCGKDKKQKNDLENKKFKNNVKIFGWVDNFTELLLASDIVVSKAGPATVWETIASGKKFIIYGCIGGVEDGDIPFAIKNGQAIYEVNSEKIAQIIPEMLEKPLPIILDKFKTNWAIEIVKRITS